MKLKRPHPINILENVSGYFWLLLLPLVRGLFAFRGGFWGWLSGVWFDLLVLAAILGFALLRWASIRYCCTDKGIFVVHGLLVQQKFTVPYREIATMSRVATFFYRPVHVVHLSVDSNAGNAWKYDFTLTLSAKAAEEVESHTKHAVLYNKSGRRKTYRSGGLYVALLAFVSSRTVAGVVFTAALVIQAGKILGNEFETTLLQGLADVAKSLAFGIPPIAVFLALLILLGWFISFVLNLSRNYRFTITRVGRGIRIRSGFFSRYHHLLNLDKVNCVESTQSILTKGFHIHSLFLHCAGYEKSKNELAVLFPAVKRERVNELLDNIIGELRFTEERMVYPAKRSIFRFVLTPVVVIVLIAAAALLFGEWFPNLLELIRFMGAMLELPVLWWLVARIQAFFHTGLSKTNGVYTLRFSRRYGFHTVMVHEKRIVKITVRQSLWQMVSGVCNVIVYLYSEGKKRYVIPALPLEQACTIFGLDVPDLPDWYRSIPFLGRRIADKLQKNSKEVPRHVERKSQNDS